MDLAREVHESVIQRLFGIQLVFSSQAELSPAARERIGAELQAALLDLRRALQRPLGRAAPETDTTLLEEVERLRREHRDLHLTLRPGSERVARPARARAARPVGARRGGPQRPQARRADARSRSASRSRTSDTLVLDVINDGVPRQGRARAAWASSWPRSRRCSSAGSSSSASASPARWRVRLAVPLDRT